MERVTVIGLLTVLCSELSTILPGPKPKPGPTDARLPVTILGFVNVVKAVSATAADVVDVGGAAVVVSTGAGAGVGRRVHKHEVSLAAIGSCWQPSLIQLTEDALE